MKMPPFNKKQDNFRARIDKKYPTKQKNNPQGFNQHKGKQLPLEKKLSDFELYQLKAKKLVSDIFPLYKKWCEINQLQIKPRNSFTKSVGYMEDWNIETRSRDRICMEIKRDL